MPIDSLLILFASVQFSKSKSSQCQAAFDQDICLFGATSWEVSGKGPQRLVSQSRASLTYWVQIFNLCLNSVVLLLRPLASNIALPLVRGLILWMNTLENEPLYLRTSPSSVLTLYMPSLSRNIPILPFISSICPCTPHLFASCSRSLAPKSVSSPMNLQYNCSLEGQGLSGRAQGESYKTKVLCPVRHNMK